MKICSVTSVFVALALGLALASCGSQSAAAHEPAAAHDHSMPPGHAAGSEPAAGHGPAPEHHAAAFGDPPVRAVELPVPPGAGEPREVHVLVDEPALKLVTIVLRRGTVLPEHDAAVPVTIQALEGSGTVIAGSERLRLDRAHAVVLAEKVPHAVEPDAGTDLVLLVHHHGRRDAGHHHD